MSNQNVGLPAPDQAYSFLHNEVYARTFFHKLASAYGIQPNTEDEARQLLEMGSKLSALQAQESVKQAEEQNGFLKLANSHLDYMLGSEPQSYQQADHDEIVKLAADMMQDADVYNSVLSLRAHEAVQAAGGQ